MKQARTRRASGKRKPSAETLLWWLLQAALFAIGLVTTNGRDVFRLPKELVFEGAAIILLGLTAALCIVMPGQAILQRMKNDRAVLGIAVAALLWTAVTTLTSTQRTLSRQSLLWVACCCAFFLLCAALTASRGISAAALPLIAPAINAAVAVIQRLGVWNPFVFPDNIDRRLRTTAYLGNPNDLSGYLLLPALATIVLSIVCRGKLRVLFGAAGVLFVGGLAVTETLSAIVALGAAVLVLIFLLSRRTAIALAAGATAALAVAVWLNVPVVQRARGMAADALAGRLNVATSGRGQGFLIAWAMFHDHPLTGVGPGCFTYWYLPYDLLLAGRNPDFLNTDAKFHDVHNDHLQLLATAGVPAYAIFIAALVYLAARTRASGAAEGTRERFVHLFAAPAATSIGMVTLAQFPLELAGPTAVFLYFTALVVAWSRTA